MPVPVDKKGIKFCKWCNAMKIGYCSNIKLDYHCPIMPDKKDYIEAAKFERKVAIWLARFHAKHNNIFGYASRDDCIHPVFHGRGECDFCGECYLKWARINVEAEMDEK